MSGARVFMYGRNFQPARMCDDPAELFYGQVVTAEGDILAKASRVYNSWFYSEVGQQPVVLDHPGGGPGLAERHAALTSELITALVRIAKAHNKIEGDSK